jgi:hypothetical protein
MGMRDDDLEEAEANVKVLIREEMDVQHRLGEHPTPAPDCPVCRSHAPSRGHARAR